MTRFLDVEDPDTWPRESRGAVKRALEDHPDLANDLETGSFVLSDEDRGSIEAPASDVPLVVFHATRLLPHEEDLVRKRGLVPLSFAFMTERITAAVTHGHLTTAEGQVLLDIAEVESRVPFRTERVCVTTSSKALQDIGGFWRLFGTWAGESVYHTLESDPVWIKRLKIGRPAFVKAAVPLTPERMVYENFDLATSMLMVLAGLPSVGEIHLDRVFAAEVANVVFDSDDEWLAVQPLSLR